ncbi:MAG: hypothetical protein HRT94_08300 [Alphaproteobacteria bacterium]|nr:hypothetical protein [Alphaproteobacteria bacterium]
MFSDTYKLIMNEDQNAFRSLPKVVKFQLMVTLAYMWCAIFSFGIGSFFFFGTSVLFHFLFLIGIFFTADLFKRAQQRQLDHRICYRNITDGSALYDDIWGG